MPKTSCIGYCWWFHFWFFLTPTEVDDRSAVFELTVNKPSIKIIADKSYVDETLKYQLEAEKNILLIFLTKKNNKNPLEKQLRNVLSKTRRRIETTFSQLAEQFNINKVKAKSKWGLMLRIVIKILAHNVSFIINKLLANKQIAQIKQLVIG